MKNKAGNVTTFLYALALIGIGFGAFHTARRVIRHTEYSVFLPSDIVPATEGYPSRGGSHALAVMVVYGDFECKYTQKMDNMTDTLLNLYPDGELRIVTKIRPLSSNPFLRLRARAGYAAHLQGKFYEMRSELKKISLPEDETTRLERLNEQIAACAEGVGLEPGRFARDLQSPKVTQLITQTISETSEFGIHSYPSALFEGVVYEGARPVSFLMPRIEASIQSQLEEPEGCHTCGDQD